MAKHENPARKPGAGAVVFSIIFFILLFLTTISLIVSIFSYTAIHRHTFSRALERGNVWHVEIENDGRTLALWEWFYEWYLDGAPGMTTEAMQTAADSDAMRGVVTQYAFELETYFANETDEYPTLSAETFADALALSIPSFTDETRSFFLWASSDDFAAYQEDSGVLDTNVGRGMTRFACSMFCVVTLSALLLFFCVLWIIVAVRGQWRRERMFIGMGLSIGLPSVLLAIAFGIGLFLNHFGIPRSLSSLQDGVSLVAMTFCNVCMALGILGVWIFIIGAIMRSVRRRRARRQKEQAAFSKPYVPEQPASQPQYYTSPSPTSAATAAPKPAPQPSAADATASKPSSTDAAATAEMPKAAPESAPPDSAGTVFSEPSPPSASAASQAPATCPNCGAPLAPHMKFCAKCGKPVPKPGE